MGMHKSFLPFLMVITIAFTFFTPFTSHAADTTTLNVRVMDEFSSEPMRGAEVIVGREPKRTSKHTGDKGGTAFVVPARNEVAVEIRADGYHPLGRIVAIPEDKPVGIRVKLTPAGTALTVFVMRRDGKPLAKAGATIARSFYLLFFPIPLPSAWSTNKGRTFLWQINRTYDEGKRGFRSSRLRRDRTNIRRTLQ